MTSSNLMPTKAEVLAANDPVLMAEYCIEIDDDTDVWKRLTTMRGPAAAAGQSLYCRYVKDRDEMWKAMIQNDPDEALAAYMMYVVDVKPRPEVLNHMKKASSLIEQLASIG